MYINFHLKRLNCLPVPENEKLICFADAILDSWQVWKCRPSVPQTFLLYNVIFSTVQHTLLPRHSFQIAGDTLHRTLHWHQTWHWLKQMRAGTCTRRTGSIWQEDGGSGHSQPSRYVESLVAKLPEQFWLFLNVRPSKRYGNAENGSRLYTRLR